MTAARALRSLPGRLASGVAVSAGRLAALAARCLYAGVEGLAFAFGSRGGRIVLAGELAVLAYHAGPRRAAHTALGLAAACAAGRALWVLLHTARSQPKLESLAGAQAAAASARPHALCPAAVSVVPVLLQPALPQGSEAHWCQQRARLAPAAAQATSGSGSRRAGTRTRAGPGAACGR